LTALENVLVGAIYSKRGRRKQFLNQALECLEILNLAEIKDTVSVHLTHSDRRLVETASALASQPTLALLDEPLAGLNPTEVEKILKIIKEIRDRRGISILWIEHKIDADRDNFHPGVWVNGDEIAAIGLSIKKWVSMHGFALNMNTDLKYFFVHPCGFSDRRATSMSKILGYNVPMEGVTNRLIFHFYDIFNFPKIIHSNLYSSIL
jgi:energy-coupling factor transporter ATP-binding protein EcfA2